MAAIERDARSGGIPPVLLVVFNRPESTRRMIDNLRTVAPAHLFVAADGPRRGHPDDIERCRATRAVIDEVDWPCDTRRLEHDENLGLSRAIVAAVDWFFEQVDEGVILEDDCLVQPDFLRFAGEVLEHHRHTDEIVYVTAVNLRPDDDPALDTYRFASCGHVWGWATWARAWRTFDPYLSAWPEHAHRFGRGASPLRRNLGRKFASAHSEGRYTWARALHFHVARQNGLVVVPPVNLVRNIGIGRDSTNTKSLRHPLARLPVGNLEFPLRHPEAIVADPAYDSAMARFHKWRLKEWIRNERIKRASA